MIRLLSFFYPITRKIKSDYNGTLEVTWYNGKKHLNTKNANYSYGSLQKILKIGLLKIDLSHCKKILLLGMGGGSVIKTLRDDFDYHHQIIAIDIDPIVISVAQKEFNVKEENNLEIICIDALKFMVQNNKKFDLIIIDLFVDTEIPNSFYSHSFWQNIVKATNPEGSILFNASLHNSDNKKLTSIIKLLSKNNFLIEKLERVNKTNTLIIGTTFS